MIFWSRCRKIISCRSTKTQKLFRHLRTDRMASKIRLMPFATARPREPGQRVDRARFQFTP
jgi:hypothetical protein